MLIMMVMTDHQLFVLERVVRVCVVFVEKKLGRKKKKWQWFKNQQAKGVQQPKKLLGITILREVVVVPEEEPKKRC